MEAFSSSYYGAKDIALLCAVSKSQAYKLIKQMNDELKAEGYLVPKAGYVSKRYAEDRLRLNLQGTDQARKAGA